VRAWAKGAYDAARRLERDIITARGEHDQGRHLERVDNDQAGDRTDAMVEASRRVDKILGRIGERDAYLLSELISPSVQTRLTGDHLARHCRLHHRGGKPPCASCRCEGGMC
jgi:hypothetical protein